MRCLKTLVFILLLVLHTLVIAKPEPVTLVMGVVPQYDARKIQQIWAPILEQVSHLSSTHIILKSSPSIPEFEQQFIRGEFDLAYMNPYHLIVANKHQGYQPILKDVDRQLSGIIVVKDGSAYQSVLDLNGKTVAFPAPNALGAALIPRYEFKNKYNISVKEKYVKSHSSVYLNVVLGLADAGGGVHRTLKQQPAEIRNKLSILYQTDAVPPHPVVVHPRLSDTVVNAVTRAFLVLGANVAGIDMLQNVPVKKIGPASMTDYKKLSEMGLDEFYVH